MNKKLSKKTWLVIVGGVCVAIWLLFANSVMAYIFVEEGGRAQEADFDDIPQKDKVIISLKTIEYVEDIWDSCIIKAGAFCETDKSHANRVTEIWLKSDKRAYKIPTTSGYRDDVYGEYIDKYKMPDAAVGFNSGFSTINIVNDTYDIYIYVWENEEAYGISNSGYQLIKNGSSILIEKKNESEEVKKIFHLMEDGRFRGALDEETLKEDGSLYLSGWGLYLDDTPDEYDSYIALADGDKIKGVYLAERCRRNDIYNAFETTNEKSGFNVTIPKEKIDFKYDKIYLVERSLTETNYYLINERQYKAKEIGGQFKGNYGELISAIDKFSVSQSGDIQISGWATDQQCDWTEYNVYIGYVSDSKIINIVEAERGSRPDISELFSINDQKAGFYVNIPANQVPEEYDHMVLVKEKDGECRFYQFIEN